MNENPLRQLIIDESNGTISACTLENGRVVEVLSGSERTPQICGNIYLGRVARLVPGLDAAFIDIGLDRTAMLSGREYTHPNTGKPLLKCGDEILLQIMKLPGGDKGPVVTRDIKLAGKMCVLLSAGDGVSVSRRIEDEKEYQRLKTCAQKLKPQGLGLIVRTAAAGACEEELKADIEALAREYSAMIQKGNYIKAPALIRDESSILFRAARDIFCEDIKEVVFSSEKLYNIFLGHVREFAPRLEGRVKLIKTDNLFAVYRIRAQMEEASRRKINLSCGGFIVIDRTEAMTVIDVNSGKYTHRHSADETILKVNLEAAAEIARQVRLRDIGGIIVVDFIDMKSRNDRNVLLEEMKKCLVNDKNRTRVIDITPLGLMEMTRKKKYALSAETSTEGEINEERTCT